MHQVKRLLFLVFFLVFTSAQAQRPVFSAENCRHVLDGLTSQYDEVNMGAGDMGENDNQVLAFIRENLARGAVRMSGFSVLTDTIFTETLHLHWEPDEVIEEEPVDMDIRGRWIVDIEWPNDETDSQGILRMWIEKTIRDQLLATYYLLDDSITPFQGGALNYKRMLNYYAGKYRRLYAEKTHSIKAEGARGGAFINLYAVEFNPVLFIRVRCVNDMFVTFYVADFRPHYRSTPSYYQQTLNRFNGNPVWLEDMVDEKTITYIKQTIRDKYTLNITDGILDEVIRDHDYRLALTESCIILSFLPYTFSTTAGSEAFQIRIPYPNN